MAYTDLVLIEGFDYNWDQLGQFQTDSDIRRCFACTSCDLLDAVLRFLQIQKSAETLCFLQRVNITTLEIFDQLRFRIGEIDDTDGYTIDFGHLVD
jgi:hypothetical protein